MGNVANLWDLQADPSALEAMAGAWTAQVKQLSWAADTINDAANRVISGGSWEGATAERYDQHRRTLVTDLDDCAVLAGKVARALGECAHVLESNQDMLTTEWLKLGHIESVDVNGQLVFHPKNEQESQQVDAATQAANEIRARVDTALHAQGLVFDSAMSQLQGWQRTYSARTLRMLNYNIQQGGGGNSPWPSTAHVGTDEKDLGTLAQRMIDDKVDVATLQEVFKGSAAQLQTELNKRAAPGDHYEVHFGKASSKWHFDDSALPIKGKEDFGDVVIVRTGHGVSTGPTTVHNLGTGDESRAAVETPINVQ